MKETYPKKEPEILRSRMILASVMVVAALLLLSVFQLQKHSIASLGVQVEFSEEHVVSDVTFTSDDALITETDVHALEYFPFTAHIGETLQYPELSAGCEIVSLTVVLRSMGFELSLTELADNYLDINYEGDFVNSYSGSPYELGAGYPPVIIDCANAYLSEHDSSYQARDLSGSDFEELIPLLDEGYPVLVWTTIGMDQPFYSGIYVDGYEWYSNEHCVVLYGLGDGTVLINDPLEGRIERDYSEFVQVYEACRNMAVVIR